MIYFSESIRHWNRYRGKMAAGLILILPLSSNVIGKNAEASSWETSASWIGVSAGNRLFLSSLSRKLGDEFTADDLTHSIAGQLVAEVDVAWNAMAS